jgi:methionyl-tRNA synthetase
MYIQYKSQSASRYEYGCDLRRLFPWKGVVTPSWGSCIASIRPGEATTPHSHDEFETFLVLSGSGHMTIEDETALLQEGDVVYIEKKRTHHFANASIYEPLVFLSIFWDSPEARQRLRKVLESDQADC